MSVSLRLTEDIQVCRQAAEELCRTLIEELARPGMYSRKTIQIEAVNGVLRAEVTTVDKYRWDLPAGR